MANPALPGGTGDGMVAGPSYEPRDASPRAVMLAGIGFLVVLGLIVLVTTLLFFSFTGTGPQLQIPPPGEAISASPPTPLPAPPQLETQPGQELGPLRAREDATLHSYAWVDRTAGIVRIPIDQAMDLVAETGVPVRPAAQQQGYRDEGLTVPSASSSGRAPEELQH